MAPSGVASVKSPEAFRTISEVADMLDVPQHVLRFWETRFPQIKPVKRAGGRRFYRPEDVDLLRGIQLLLYYEGYTIRGAQKVLREKGVRYTATLGRELRTNGHAERAPLVDAPIIEVDDADALDMLPGVVEDAPEPPAGVIDEEMPETVDDSTDTPVPQLIVRAAEALSDASPRHQKLHAIRSELLGLKSRIAAARARTTS